MLGEKQILKNPASAIRLNYEDKKHSFASGLKRG